MIRSTELPFLPGYSFNYNVGQTRFHKSQHLELIGKEIPYLSEKTLPGIGGVPLANTEVNKFPSLYARGEVTELPTWLVYDKETLSFDAYYLQNVYEGGIYKNYMVHQCKICYFLEDGTIQVFEKPINNSGLLQGCLIRRQKIKLPTAGNSPLFYDVIDFNIGKEIDIFGKVFKITNCDLFTRRFLNRLGIAVPEPLEMPLDPYIEIRRMQDEGQKMRKEKVKTKTLKKLLEMDKRILKFDAYWDDTKSPSGCMHNIKIFYFLADDTMEIKDVTDPQNLVIIFKRNKFPKDMEIKIPGPGASEKVTILNVIGPSVEKSRKILDPLGLGLEAEKEYYTDRDLTIGTVLGYYGRMFVITDMSPFAKDYYKHKYGIEDLNPIPTPPTKEDAFAELGKGLRPKTPPYNGFGDYEDSMKSVKFLIPSAKITQWKLDPEKQPLGYDGKILRFGATLIENGVEVKGRRFIVRYYIMDDTISVYEIPFANSGRDGGTIIKRRKIPIFGQNILKSSPPETVSLNEFYIGNIVNLDNFKFKLIETDEYTMRYMDERCHVFQKNNIIYVMDKLKRKLQTQFKKWAQSFVTGNKSVPYHVYRKSLIEAMGDELSEHEILALGRHYIEDCAEDPEKEKKSLRELIHDELRRNLYEDYEKLRECFLHFDPAKTGNTSLADTYSILRGSKIPLSNNIIFRLLRLFSEKNDEGEEEAIIKYNKVIEYLDYRKHQVPSGYRTDFAAGFAPSRVHSAPTLSCGFRVNVNKLIDDLHLEEHLKQQST